MKLFKTSLLNNKFQIKQLSFFVIQFKYMNQIAIFSIIAFLASSFQHCSSSNNVIGCITCSSSFSKAFNISEDYFTCISISNCTIVSANSCVQCHSPYVYDTVLNTCTEVNGCLQLANTTCTKCGESYVLEQGQCSSKVSFCTSYNGSQCESCQHEFMLPESDCLVDINLCAEFDYSTWKCLNCPDNTIFHQSGSYCVPPVSNCISYGINGCLLCEKKYVLTNGTCTIADYTETMNSAGAYEKVCLNRNAYENNANCETATDHCLDANCSSCIPSYYLSNSVCSECSSAIENCLTCSSQSVCTTCERQYYLSTTSTETKCMPCSVYSCLQCSNIGDSVQCLSCHPNGTLFDGSCYICQNGFSFSIADKKCIACSINNCQNCQITPVTNGSLEECKWCSDAFNVQNSECTQISSSSAITTANAEQILTKAAPGIQTIVYNDQSTLMRICQNSNGYVCQCQNTSTLTSLCSIQSFSGLDVSTLFTSDVTCAQLREYSDILRMGAEFSTFDETISTTNCFMSEYDYWNLLSIYTFQIQRNSGLNTLLQNIETELNTMVNVFSQSTVTIITGNGFYYKFVPLSVTAGDDGFISADLIDSWVLFFVLFQKYTNSSQLTGNIYVFTNSSSTFRVNVQKLGYADNVQNFTLMRGGSIFRNSTVSLSDGILTITNFTKSSASAVYGFQVFSQAESTVDLYEAERIEFIFWNQSFIYILVFLTLYLIFLPLCSLVDCCKAQSLKRKRVSTSEDMSSSDKNLENERERVIKINYRDFFPLYNIGNTPRPRRLLKLCLFLLNCQHGITLLVLAYFTLQADSQIIAIVLAIPCYVGTIIMGYICGFLIKILPSFSKYFINFIAIGYWALWVILMRIYTSVQYKLYVVVFMIIFLILDLIIDLLETLLVYFTIKQEDKQVSLFRCLAKWLSYRGFYEFEKLTDTNDE